MHSVHTQSLSLGAASFGVSLLASLPSLLPREEVDIRRIDDTPEVVIHINKGVLPPDMRIKWIHLVMAEDPRHNCREANPYGKWFWWSQIFVKPTDSSHDSDRKHVWFWIRIDDLWGCATYGDNDPHDGVASMYMRWSGIHIRICRTCAMTGDKDPRDGVASI